MRQFLDVMDEAEELPLRIDLFLSAQREAIESFVVPEIPEHRLDRGKPLAIKTSAFFTVDRPFHQIGIAHLRCIGFPAEEADLSDFGLLRGAQAFLSLITRHAVT